MWRAEFIAARPLAWLALAAITGVLLADTAAPFLPGWPWAAASAALVTVAVLFRARPAPGVIFLLTGAVFGFLHSVSFDLTWKNELHRTLAERSAPLDVSATGRIVKPLRRDLPGTEPGQALFIAEDVAAPLIGKSWHGPMRLRVVTGKNVDLAPGRYHFEGRALLPRPPDNPGQFDQRRFDLRHGLVAELRVRDSALMQPERWAFAAWLDHGAQCCREWFKQTLNTGMNGDDAAHRIILATVLGGAEAEARDLEQPFRVTGTIHIFAVSGLHVGIVGWILWRLLKPLGFSRGWMAVVVCVMLFGYAFLTGLRSSTVRAAAMAAVLLSGEVWQRRSDMLNSLGAAALLLLLADTSQLFSVGFQLSFGVVSSIALLQRPILGLMRPLTEPDEFMPELLLGRSARAALVTRRWLAGTLSISAASWIGSLPFCMGYFNLVTPIALLANVVLVPIAFMILFVSILAFAAALAHLPLVPLLLGHANWFFARAAIVSAQTFAGIPGGNFYVELPSPTGRAPAEINVLRLRAGGAAQHLRTTASHWLFDCGGVKDYDYLLRAYLNHTAVNRLTGLVLSHADFEHIGAAPEVIRDCAPRQIFLSALETGTRSSSLRRLRALGVQPVALSTGDSLDFGGTLPARAEVLFPSRTFRPAKADDRTLVLRLDLGLFRILWCNDAGFTAEKFIVDNLPPDAALCDVLIRNQHANDTSLIPEFLDRARPRLIVSSNNTFPEVQKMPPRIREQCAERHITLLDQAETGAVSLRFWPQRLEVVPFRGPSAVVTLVPR